MLSQYDLPDTSFVLSVVFAVGLFSVYDTVNVWFAWNSFAYVDNIKHGLTVELVTRNSYF